MKIKSLDENMKKALDFIRSSNTGPEPIGNDNSPVEIPETAINHDAVVETWLPHTKGRQVTCRLWRILPCNFRFLLNGWIVVGPGTPLWTYLIFLLTIVTFSFVVFDVLPFYETWPDSIIGLILGFLSCSAIYSLLRTVFTDPGYMLPNWFSTQNSWLTKDVTLKEVYEKHGYTSYCPICKIFQFPDTFHCNDCNACIDGGDHHCLLLGTCVGKRNYRFFYIFTITTNLALWMGLIVSITHLIENWIANGALFALAHAVTLYLILSTIALPPLGMFVMVILPIVHTKLIYQGVTLNEKDTFAKLWKLRDLSKSEKLCQFLGNFYIRIIKAPPPSQIPYRVLQLKVRMPAIPRTELANTHHQSLQTEHSVSKVKLVMTSMFSQDRLLNFRMKYVHRDIDLFGHMTISIENLQKAQKDIAEAAKSSRSSSTTKSCSSCKLHQKPAFHRNILSFCLSCNATVFPAGIGKNFPKVVEGNNQTEMIAQTMSNIV